MSYPPFNLLAGLSDFGMKETLILFVALALIGVCALLTVRILRFQMRFSRKWESVDKRLSEVLWRTRHSDAEELRKRTAMLEERLEESMGYLQRVASAMDAQIESLRGELKTSFSKVGTADSKTLGQNRMVIYQLERMRNQLKMLETMESKRPLGGARQRSGGKGSRKQQPLVSSSGVGYRMEAVLEPISGEDTSETAPQQYSPSEDAELPTELSWET